MTEATSQPQLKWSAQLDVLPEAATPTSLKGDKIILPQSSLEQLLSAATVNVTHHAPPSTSFDPFNPYSFAAERQAREQVVERQQNLPHPLTFRLVNPRNGRILYAGIREFSASENTVGLSSFVRKALGLNEENTKERPDQRSDHPTTAQHLDHVPELSRLTVHAQQLPKGTFVKLRPLEAGYDTDDWKALLEQHLRNTFTTLTNGEEIAIPAGREVFRFLVDELRPAADAVSLVDTDLEVDIEPLSEEQARETLQKLAKKSQRAPCTKDGSSAGGRLQNDSNETGQVRLSEYVDYSVENWDPKQDLEIEVTSLDEEQDVDLLVVPHTTKHRAKPREDHFVFGDLSSRPTKRIKIRHTNVELDGADSISISIRGYATKDIDKGQANPIPYSLRISPESLSTEGDEAIQDAEELQPEEERCSNCRQAVPKRTMFLHQNFCLRNNVLCPHCQNVFQKASDAWRQHWHCPYDDSHGNTASSKAKHDTLMHTPHSCLSCDFEAASIPSLAQHRTTTCPGKLILCQFCHLQVPQQGPEDPSPDSAEVLLSGLAPHEVSDGARTTECHLCSKIVRLRDMAAHLKHHDHQRLSRRKPRICRNANCGRTADLVSKTGEVQYQSHNDLGLCDACFGPLYVSQYDPDGKAIRRRVERKYLTQLLTGCKQPWCRNELCRTGRENLDIDGGSAVSSKEASALIRPFLDGLKDLNVPAHFCTDEASQKRRTLANLLAVENARESAKGKGKDIGQPREGYELEWCIAALETEAGDLDKARGWLQGFAPKIGEGPK